MDSKAPCRMETTQLPVSLQLTIAAGLKSGVLYKGDTGGGCRGCGHDDRCHGGVGAMRVTVTADVVIVMREVM